MKRGEMVISLVVIDATLNFMCETVLCTNIEHKIQNKRPYARGPELSV